MRATEQKSKPEDSEDYIWCEVFFVISGKHQFSGGVRRALRAVAKGTLYFRPTTVRDNGFLLTFESDQAKAVLMTWAQAGKFLESCFEIRAKPEIQAAVSDLLTEAVHAAPIGNKTSLRVKPGMTLAVSEALTKPTHAPKRGKKAVRRGR